MEVEATGASGDVATEATPMAAADDAGRGKAVEHAAPSSETRGATEQAEDDSGGQKAVGDEAGSPDPAPAQEGDAAHIPVADERSAADPSTPADKAAKPAGKLKAQYKVACLNCGVQLYVELPPNVVNFQCCQCYAVHKVIQPDPALAAEENRKRKRKDRKGGGGPEPRELTGYNKFMQQQLEAIKKNNPGLSHRDAFKQASALWATSPENPKVAAALKQTEAEAALQSSSATAPGASAQTDDGAASVPSAAPPAVTQPPPASTAAPAPSAATPAQASTAAASAPEISASAVGAAAAATGGTTTLTSCGPTADPTGAAAQPQPVDAGAAALPQSAEAAREVPVVANAAVSAAATESAAGE